MNGCGKFDEFLARRIHGGGLSREESARIEEHLAACPSCSASARDLEALHDALLRLPGRRVDPPADLARRILAAISVRPISIARWRRAAVVGGAMAAGVLLTLAVQHVLPGKGGATGSAPPSAVREVRTASAAPAAAEAPSSRPRRATSAPPAGHEKVTVVREVKIFLFHPEAKQVAVTGDFNNWDPKGVELHPGERPGLWEGELRLGPGAYSYNFIVDGDVLVPDPSAAGQSPDGYGGTNSILLVKEGSPS